MKLRENRAESHSLKVVAYDNVQVFRHNICASEAAALWRYRSFLAIIIIILLLLLISSRYTKTAP